MLRGYRRHDRRAFTTKTEALLGTVCTPHQIGPALGVRTRLPGAAGGEYDGGDAIRGDAWNIGRD